MFLLILMVSSGFAININSLTMLLILSSSTTMIPRYSRMLASCIRSLMIWLRKSKDSDFMGYSSTNSPAAANFSNSRILLSLFFSVISIAVPITSHQPSKDSMVQQNGYHRLPLHLIHRFPTPCHFIKPFFCVACSIGKKSDDFFPNNHRSWSD
ncbi:hypothetical protein SAMN05444672_1596 [Bacillus sp. OK838]|nr:hypothetical protein SAMN05444672_1596 [Bacillus sp. OK838]